MDGKPHQRWVCIQSYLYRFRHFLQWLYLCLLNNVLLIGTFPVLFPNNTGKMKKKMITLIKSMKKDLQIKLYFEKKITNDKKTIPGTETIVTSSGFVYFFLSEEGILKLARWGAIYPLRFMLYYTVPDCRKER